MHTPWNNPSRKNWLCNVYYTIVVCRKLSCVVPMSTSVITITMKTKWSTMTTWMTGGRRTGPRPRSTSTNTINTLSKIETGRVIYLFGHTFVSCTITPTIYSLGVRVASMGPISNSPITTNSISSKFNNLLISPWLWEK